MNDGIKERIVITNNELTEIETRFSNEMHVRRYALAKMFAEGKVLDVACGCGYGTFLLQKSEFVKKIIGIDKSEEAIMWARKNFGTDKTTYNITDIKDYDTGVAEIDTVVCLEAIEHLEDPKILFDLVLRSKAHTVLLSYPIKKTKHYNKFHLHDITLEDIKRLFIPLFNIMDTYEYFKEFEFVVLKRI